MRPGTRCAESSSWARLRVADPITEPTHRIDDTRSELAPQPRDEDLNRVRVAFGIDRIDVFRELPLRDRASAVVHEIRQNAEFKRGEANRLPSDGDAAAS